MFIQCMVIHLQPVSRNAALKEAINAVPLLVFASQQTVLTLPTECLLSVCLLIETRLDHGLPLCELRNC